LQAHREGNKLELDDARLAIQSRVNSSFTQPPPRELMLELAKERNAQPLDVVPRQFGVLLPPDELALTRPVFQLDLGKK
jgi:transcription initiation factor TFIID subunit 9B